MSGSRRVTVPVFVPGQDVCWACNAKGLKAKKIFKIETLSSKQGKNPDYRDGRMNAARR